MVFVLRKMVYCGALITQEPPTKVFMNYQTPLAWILQLKMKQFFSFNVRKRFPE